MAGADVERALGAATVTTYERAAAAMAGAPPAPEGKAADRCAICLSEYAGGNELVRVVSACGHFFHAASTAGSGGAGRARSAGAGCGRCRSASPCQRWPSPSVGIKRLTRAEYESACLLNFCRLLQFDAESLNRFRMIRHWFVVVMAAQEESDQSLLLSSEFR